MTDPNIVACLKEHLLIAKELAVEVEGPPTAATVLAVYDRLVAALQAGYQDDLDDEMLDDLVVPAAKEPW